MLDIGVLELPYPSLVPTSKEFNNLRELLLDQFELIKDKSPNAYPLDDVIQVLNNIIHIDYRYLDTPAFERYAELQSRFKVLTNDDVYAVDLDLIPMAILRVTFAKYGTMIKAGALTRWDAFVRKHYPNIDTQLRLELNPIKSWKHSELKNEIKT